MNYTSIPGVQKLSFGTPRVLQGLTRWRVSLACQVIDIFIILALALLLYPLSGHPVSAIMPRYIYSSLLAAVVCHFSFLQGHAYDIDTLTSEFRSLRVVFIRWSLLFLSAAAFAALTRIPELYSRVWFASYYLVGITALAAERFMVAFTIRVAIRHGFVIRSVAVVGKNNLSEVLIERLRGNKAGIRVVGLFDHQTPISENNVMGTSILGDVNDLLNLSLQKNIDLVVITVPLTDLVILNNIIHRLQSQPLNIRILPGIIGLDRVSTLGLSRSELPGVQLISVSDRPIPEVALFIKNALDRVFALVALILLSPLFLIIAIGISLSSPGPVFFKQVRVGFRGEFFRIYKFRTMHHEFVGSYTPTRRNDNRIFRFGSWLRKSSLDELPQLINVLLGEMSIVGPRPHAVGQTVEGKLLNHSVDEYAARHRVKPGITGWAQINGWRGPADTIELVERRVEHDIYYIENWSLLFDFTILIKTPFVGLFGDNAF